MTRRTVQVWLVGLCVLLGSTPVFAQTRTNISNGSSLPANCTIGDVWMKTGTSPGAYLCLATDTWTLSSGSVTPGGSSGNLQTNNGSSGLGAYAGTACTAQFVRSLNASGTAVCESVANGDLAGSIAASKLVGTDIATVGTVTTGTWQGTRIGVTFGGTGLTAGTSGGILGFTGTGTISSSIALTLNMPVIGGGAGATPTVGTVSGNTTKFATMSGSITSGNCVKVDASGNLIDFGGACGGSGSPGGSDTQVQFNDSSSFGGDAGFTFNKTTNDATLTGIIKSAGQNNAYRTATSTATFGVTDGTIECLTNAFTANLPTAVGISGRLYTLKNLQTANSCTLDPAGSETVDGAATLGVANGSITVQSDNANWRVVSAAGVPISAVTQGDLLYASAANVLSSLAKNTSADRVLMNTGTSNNPAWNTVSTAAIADNAITLAKMATQANKTVLGNNSGGTAVPTALTAIPLAPIYLFNAGVCQNTTASIGTSLFTSATPTARCVTGTNVTFGTAQFTATAQQIQGMIRVPSDVSGTAVTISGQFFGETTSAGNVTWTFSFARVANGTDPSAASFTDCSDMTPAAGNAGELNSFTQSCTITSMAAGDLLMWKFRYKTAPTTPGNQDLINLAIIPVRLMVIGG